MTYTTTTPVTAIATLPSTQVVEFGQGPILRTGLVPQDPQVVRARQAQDLLTYEQAEGRILDELWIAHLNQFTTSECFAHSISCVENLDYLVAARVQQIHEAFYAGSHPVIAYDLRNFASVVEPHLVSEAPAGSSIAPSRGTQPGDREGLVDCFKSLDQIRASLRAEQRAKLTAAQRFYRFSLQSAGAGVVAYAASWLLAGPLSDAFVPGDCSRSVISQSSGDFREGAIDRAVADCKRPGLMIANGLANALGGAAFVGLAGAALLAGNTALNERERSKQAASHNATIRQQEEAVRRVRYDSTVSHNATLIPGRGHFHRLVAELVLFNSVCDSTGKPALASFLSSVPRIQRCEIWLLMVDALSERIAKAGNLARVSAGLAAFSEITWSPYVTQALATWRAAGAVETRQVSVGGLVERYQQELASGLTVTTADQYDTVTGNLVALILAQVNLRATEGGTFAGELASKGGFTRKIRNNPDYGHLLPLAQRYDHQLTGATIAPLLDELVGAGLIQVRTTERGGKRWFPVNQG